MSSGNKPLYPSRYWPRSMTPYGVSRPQWAKLKPHPLVTLMHDAMWRHKATLSFPLTTNNIEHYDDVIMGAIASQITSLTIVYSTVYSGANQSKHQSSASLAFVRGIHWGSVNSPHKSPVTRKKFPFDDVIMAPTGASSGYPFWRRSLENAARILYHIYFINDTLWWPNALNI